MIIFRASKLDRIGFKIFKQVYVYLYIMSLYMLERIEKTGNAKFSKATCALIKQTARLRDFFK